MTLPPLPRKTTRVLKPPIEAGAVERLQFAFPNAEQDNPVVSFPDPTAGKNPWKSLKWRYNFP
jgi:hypothetical protein